MSRTGMPAGRLCGQSSGRLLTAPRQRDRGQITVLVIGLFALAILLIVGGIDVTAAHLARVRLVDTADAAALDAADALDQALAYHRGIGDSVTVSDSTVRQSVAGYLAARPLPGGVEAVAVDPSSGTPDGQSVVVVLTGRAVLPMTGGVLAALGRSVTITVEARARAPLRD
ncbi:MAG: pilus assembly protein TadG-related protein [Dermatophilaceae bacterium]